MTDNDTPPAGFERGNDFLNELLADPERAARVAELRAEMAEMDRLYAENLAAIRRAGDLTQVQLAQKLGVGQAVVSRVERHHDMLLSTLADYLHATGARQPRIVAVLNGMEVELDLDRFRGARSA
ncbi:helix-turn-helix domain-containing protein [Kribbella sp. NPDC056951]|uniref:helix-turn-helix domain-containing protein n=1 Tax=Kribbella sp. NPDC056951 TaxID=3345978 RepID=UPI003635B419